MENIRVIENIFTDELNQLLSSIKNFDDDLIRVSKSSPKIMFMHDLPNFDKKSFLKKLSIKLKPFIFSFLDVNQAVLLDSWHTIRKIESKDLRITGIHYDFQTSSAIANAYEKEKKIKSVTIWIPLQDVSKNDAGLIIFDKNITLKDIHNAAGEEGYLKNIKFISYQKENKNFTDNPQFKKYIIKEDSPHIVDTINNLQTTHYGFERLKKIHRRCMNNIYKNLRGKFYITELKFGDVLLFNSECYHGTYIPKKLNFKTRYNFDIRACIKFKQNSETTIFSGIKLQNSLLDSIVRLFHL